MKKLSIMLSVVLVLALAVSVAGFAKQDVVCKATGGAQLFGYEDSKVNFTFNVTLYDNGVKGSALWMDHEFGKTKFDVTGVEACDEDSMTFIAEIIATNVEAYPFEKGDEVGFTVTDDTVTVDWISPDLSPVKFDLAGGNIIIH